MGDGDEPRARRDGGEHRVLVSRGDDDTRAARVERAEQAEVLLVGRHDLVARREAEPGDDDLAAARRRVGERDLLRRRADDLREAGAHLLAQPGELLDVRHPAAALLEIAREPRLRRLDRRARQRPVRAGVEVRLALEHRELGAGLLEGHPTTASTGA